MRRKSEIVSPSTPSVVPKKAISSKNLEQKNDTGVKAENQQQQQQQPANNLRYGPMPQFPNQKRFTRFIIIMSMMIVVYFYSNKDKERTLASVGMSVSQRTMSKSCSRSLIEEISQYKDCVPLVCGRGVYDTTITMKEVDILRELADKGFALSTPSGGAAILDLHSGALSRGQQFVNIYTINAHNFLSQEDIATYRAVRAKIQHIIAAQFMVDPSSMHLTHPTFFSRLTSAPAQTVHDEYWHTHVDKNTYPSFHYTALLYLSNYKSDFNGGRFHFVEDDNSTYVVEPVKGRVLLFTSGAENPHRVEPVTSGVRTALTIAFTCHEKFAIKDPIMRPPLSKTQGAK